ncbi:phosphoribosyltransferase [Clostridium intestinale]|uniref:phosphoribosyltransferase n=1 Tax=Clostridium intestinale TaxID=36845 RepID=UPI0028E22C2B|nr:phosphoribosyltransferase [Clostridium intestinale]
MRSFKKGIYSKEKKDYKITPYIIEKATEVFNKNKWNIKQNETEEQINWQMRFNMYCSMLSRLDKPQQELVLELTQDYEYISSSNYMAQLYLLLTKLYKENYENIKQYNKVYVMPLIAPNDKALNKVKSSTHLAYLFFVTELAYNEYIKGIDFIRIEKLDALPKGINSKCGSIIFLVDDFIGTGDTALDALKELKDAGISNNKIIIVSILGMSLGIDKLRKMGIKVFSLFIKDRGITDKYDGKELEQKKAIMRSIEEDMNIVTKLNFGYQGSEALVTMARTPNNTFPVFWDTGKKNQYIAPFPRR